MFIALLATAFIILLVLSVRDVHDSVVLLRAYEPDAKISKSAQVAYDTVHAIKAHFNK